MRELETRAYQAAYATELLRQMVEAHDKGGSIEWLMRWARKAVAEGGCLHKDFERTDNA